MMTVISALDRRVRAILRHRVTRIIARVLLALCLIVVLYRFGGAIAARCLDAARAVRQNATALEVLRVFVSGLALWYTIAALRRAARYYRHRLDLPRENSDDPAEDADFLAVDYRVELALAATAFHLLAVALLSMIAPPPAGMGPYNFIALISGFQGLFLGLFIIGVKIRNRSARGRIFRRIEARIASMTMRHAREMTQPERSRMSNAMQVQKDDNQELRRSSGVEIDDLLEKNARLAAKLRRVGVDPGADAPPLADV